MLTCCIVRASVAYALGKCVPCKLHPTCECEFGVVQIILVGGGGAYTISLTRVWVHEVLLKHVGGLLAWLKKKVYIVNIAARYRMLYAQN